MANILDGPADIMGERLNVPNVSNSDSTKHRVMVEDTLTGTEEAAAHYKMENISLEQFSLVTQSSVIASHSFKIAFQSCVSTDD